MTEREIEKVLVDGIKKMQGVAFKFISPGNTGVPDRIVCLPTGSVWFVELKVKNKKPTKLQERQLERLKRMKCNTAVLRGIEDVNRFLNWCAFEIEEGGDADEIRTP